jgi:uncharacterized protein YjbI with pentapeptide repeats
MSRTRIQLGRRADLGGDCANCSGWCCVALAFAASSDFPVNKAAGDPCTNLASDDSCRIHDRLRDSGYRGCTVFDCFGAGQKVTQHTFAGQSWRDSPTLRDEAFAVFPVMRRMHELLWYLDCALSIAPEADLCDPLAELFDRVQQLTLAGPVTVRAIDTDLLYDSARPLLVEASARHRSRSIAGPRNPRLRPGADLAGASLAGADLRAADLRGALLIGADLAGADLRDCDLLGVDLRDARVANADLSSALYLTQTQVSSAHGDSTTRLPMGFARPAHWHPESLA